jgi:predicted molibdopterin-dependent oxidoreductase YjgC
MVKIKINNTDYEAPEGFTILAVAKSAGLSIPTLCHKEGLPYYSSCMVCMVKDNRTNSFVPSCSALVQEGMDIDTSGDDVISIRKKAVELLLSEHRAECEAPCRVVCPAGYNIPLMNRLLAERKFEEAINLSVSVIDNSGIRCTECPGYCENACRRKKVDLPVSIRNLQLYIFQNSISEKVNNEEDTSSGLEKRKLPKRFTSLTGRLEEGELKEWLKECNGAGSRFREIPDNISAAGESENCMHCDCRAADDCRLRDLADQFQIKDPRGKLINSPIEKKINKKTGLIFENAKCIKCGLCVRLCEDLKEEPALCFNHRGFVTIISEPITEEFDDILKTKSKEVIEICPTGALSQLK